MAPLSDCRLLLAAASTVPARAAGQLLAGCLLAASTVPARATALLLAVCLLATSAVTARTPGLLLASCLLAIPARATQVLLTSRGSAMRARLLAAFAVPARATEALFTSRGSAMRARRLVGCLLAASAVPARAAGHMLASRGSALAVASLGSLLLFAACAVHARAARHLLASRGSALAVASLGSLLLFSEGAVPAGAAGDDFYLYADEPAMRVIATALGADRALGWTNNTSPRVDGWNGVVCNRRGSVSAIHARDASLNGTLAELRDNSITGDVPSMVFLNMKRLRLDGNKFTFIHVLARAAGLLLAGCLLAAFAVPARYTEVLLTSRGSAIRARLLAACGVPARASRHLLASRGSALTVASLGCLFLFAACIVPARAAGGIAHPYFDEITMREMATALGADRALGWTNGTSPCVDAGWTGVVCNSIGRVSEIRVPRAGLNGTLPSNLILLNALQVLDLRDNAITGDIPDAVFLYLMSLRLDGNNFNSVPAGFLGAARSLQVFSISNSSRLQYWELPNDPSRLGTLREYIADNAHVSGTLSRFLGKASSFRSLGKLVLANNMLTGDVPAAFTSQTLTHLDLSHNSLTGPVDFIANLPELEVLRLDGNNFTGPLPDFSGHWRLRVVDVAHNRLTGVVPASLVRLESLTSVSIAHNLLQGSVPEFAMSVHSDVAEAALDGSFCRPKPGPCDRHVQSLIAIAGAFRFPEAFAVDWKGNNPCDGWLGVYCDKRGAVAGLNFGRLGLNGTLNPAFGDLKSLVMIILAGNNLTGNVPRSIATLPSLKILDVSDNSLSGTMPTFRSDVRIWAAGNKDLTVAAASGHCISDTMRRFAAAAAAAIVALVLA